MENKKEPTALVGFGIGKSLELSDGYSSARQIKAIKEFANKGWTDSFYEVVNNEPYEISRARGKVAVVKKVLDKELAKNLLVTWKENSLVKMNYWDWDYVDTLERWYGRVDRSIFVPGFSRKPTKVVIGTGGDGFWQIAKSFDKTEKLLKKVKYEFHDLESFSKIIQLFEIARTNKFILTFLDYLQ